MAEKEIAGKGMESLIIHEFPAETVYSLPKSWQMASFTTKFVKE
ncbi:MAG: hypothetical protein R2788_18700 [Saprospiraceae bacterium]